MNIPVITGKPRLTASDGSYFYFSLYFTNSLLRSNTHPSNHPLHSNRMWFLLTVWCLQRSHTTQHTTH